MGGGCKVPFVPRLTKQTDRHTKLYAIRLNRETGSRSPFLSSKNQKFCLFLRKRHSLGIHESSFKYVFEVHFLKYVFIAIALALALALALARTSKYSSKVRARTLELQPRGDKYVHVLKSYSHASWLRLSTCTYL